MKSDAQRDIIYSYCFGCVCASRSKRLIPNFGKSTSLKPYTLVKHAIAWSLKEQGKVTSFSSDNEGLELNRQTITGEYDDYFKVLIEQAEGRHLSNEEYFPKYIKAHIDRGAIILESRYKHAGDLDKYVLEALGVGDTV